MDLPPLPLKQDLDTKSLSLNSIMLGLPSWDMNVHSFLYSMPFMLWFTQYSIVIKCFQCDLGREYNNVYSLKSSDTIRQSSCGKTPDQNGVKEHKHRHIMDNTTHSFLFPLVRPVSFRGKLFLLLCDKLIRFFLLSLLVFSTWMAFMGCFLPVIL